MNRVLGAPLSASRWRTAEMKARRLILPLVVALGIVAGVSSGARGAFPGVNGPIGFLYGCCDLYDGDLATYAPGSGQVTFLANELPRWNPVWSPDGTQVAWSQDGDVRLRDAHGGLHWLTSTGDVGEVVNWLPSGKQLYFSCGRTVCEVNTDGSGFTRLDMPGPSYYDVALSPNGKRIAWHYFGQIFFANRDGSDVQPSAFTASPCSYDEKLAWSPDSSSLAYCDDNSQLQVLNDTGYHLFATDAAGDPAWSPDGTQIVFPRQTSQDNRYRPLLAVINADGTNEHNLVGTDGNAIAGNEVDWLRAGAAAPNPAQAVAAHDNSGVDGAITYERGDSIWSIESGKVTSVATHDAGNHLTRPLWAPDGHTLGFVQSTDQRDSRPHYEIQAMDTTTGRARNVASIDETNFAWSPDGSLIAVVCGRSICVMNADGTSRWIVQTGLERQPYVYPTDLEWSPDGRIGYIASASNAVINPRITLVNADGTGSTTVSPSETNAVAFSFSADGKHIAYTEANHLVVIDADGNHWHVVDPYVVGTSRPAWSPNGQLIAYEGYDDAGNTALFTVKPDGSGRAVIRDASGDEVDGQNPTWQRGETPEKAPAVTLKPAIAGSPRAGHQLTADHGTWTGDVPQTYAIQWERCGTDGATCSPVAGATDTTYTVRTGDAGSRLRIVVKATNTAGSVSAASDATAPVPEPALSAVHAHRSGKTVRLSLSVCDQSPASVTVLATDWSVRKGSRRGTKRHAWIVGAGPGCHAKTFAWQIPTAGARILVVSARDGDGVATKSLRLSLR